MSTTQPTTAAPIPSTQGTKLTDGQIAVLSLTVLLTVLMVSNILVAIGTSDFGKKVLKKKRYY